MDDIIENVKLAAERDAVALAMNGMGVSHTQKKGGYTRGSMMMLGDVSKEAFEATVKPTKQSICFSNNKMLTERQLKVRERLRKKLAARQEAQG